jgi:hypothetical protein
MFPIVLLAEPWVGYRFNPKALEGRSMRMRRALILTGSTLALTAVTMNAQSTSSSPPDPRLENYKKEVVADIEGRRLFTQQMVDQLFSFSELGFQEVETHRQL